MQTLLGAMYMLHILAFTSCDSSKVKEISTLNAVHKQLAAGYILAEKCERQQLSVLKT